MARSRVEVFKQIRRDHRVEGGRSQSHGSGRVGNLNSADPGGAGPRLALRRGYRLLARYHRVVDTPCGIGGGLSNSHHPRKCCARSDS